MRASLAMYAHPALNPALQRYWQAIRAGMPAHAPRDLTPGGTGLAFWRAPDLLLSQTCGLPFRAHLVGKVHLVGTPDYGLPDCPPGHYFSAVIARQGESRQHLGDFAGAKVAVNDWGSQSGYAALLAHSQGIPLGPMRATGSHLASARAVAEGQADLAAIDAVTWRLIQAHTSLPKHLKVIAKTKPTPGLPYICARGQDPCLIAKAVATAIDGLMPEDAQRLGLRGLIHIPEKDYLALPIPDYPSRSGTG